MRRSVSFTLNNKPVRLTLDDQRPLLWVLRSDLGLTGTKFGCGEALCGACTVLVDNEPVRACAAQIRDVDGKKVVTIEGLAREGRLHPLQEAFVRHNAFQCGYCTSGMILSAHALLLRTPLPSRDQILEQMNDNLCRCGSHTRVVDAIQAAALAIAAAAAPRPGASAREPAVREKEPPPQGRANGRVWAAGERELAPQGRANGRVWAAREKGPAPQGWADGRVWAAREKGPAPQGWADGRVWAAREDKQ